MMPLIFVNCHWPLAVAAWQPVRSKAVVCQQYLPKVALTFAVFLSAVLKTICHFLLDSFYVLGFSICREKNLEGYPRSQANKKKLAAYVGHRPRAQHSEI